MTLETLGLNLTRRRGPMRAMTGATIGSGFLRAGQDKPSMVALHVFPQFLVVAVAAKGRNPVGRMRSICPSRRWLSRVF